MERCGDAAGRVHAARRTSPRGSLSRRFAAPLHGLRFAFRNIDLIQRRPASEHGEKEWIMNLSRRSPVSGVARITIAASARGLALASIASGAFAQFVDTNPGMATSAFGCVVPGDYNHDGAVDVLVIGSGSHDIAFSTIYRNVGGVFSDSGIPLLGLAPQSASAAQSAAWGDFDGDGDLDLAMTGLTTAGVPTTVVYRNDGGVFTLVPGSFLGVFGGTVTWADYDGDGDLDLLVTGVTGSSAGSPAATRLYRNDGGVFTSVPHPFPNVYLGPVAWGDYDGDGRIDVLICGADSAGGLSATLWHNTRGGTFVDAGARLPGLDLGFAKWGDYDGDGDLDLLFGGNSNAGFITRIYRNDGGTLTDIGANLLPVIWSAAAWGDYDHDGDLDAMIIGYDPVAQVSRSILYRNDGGTFVDSGDVFHNVYLGSVSWIDYDNDGDLDLLLSGNEVGADILRLYRNDATSGTSFCFGDGSLATACPCGNFGANGNGCASSQVPAGAHLQALGSTSPDHMLLTATHMLPSASSVFLQGNAVSTSGVPFGDGVRCASGQLLRLGVKTAAMGMAQYPGANDLSITARSAALGARITPGSSRTYQTYYRDPNPTFCPAPQGNTWNITNAVTIVW